jgi:molybdopterin molybdotransferase
VREVVDVSQSSALISAPRVTVDEARTLARELAPLAESEGVAVTAATGRTLAEDVVTSVDFPLFSNSAMDGWALRAADVAKSPAVIGEARAGVPFIGKLPPGKAVAISTGAALPEGADAVVPLENAEMIEGSLVVQGAAKSGDHIRPAARYAAVGDVVLRAGTVVGAGEVTALSALGIAEVEVRVRPRVAIICGGDELLRPGDAAPPGAVYDCNTPMLTALLKTAGCERRILRYRSDDTEAIAALLETALDSADVVVSSGGISVGDHDHLGEVLQAAGCNLVAAGTSARPAHHMAIATTGDNNRAAAVFALPGNPLSTWVGHQLYLRRFIRAMLGREMPPRFEATLDQSVKRLAEETRILPGVTSTSLGRRCFEPRVTQSDDALAIVGCNALALLEPGDSVAHDGVHVECEKVDG